MFLRFGLRLATASVAVLLAGCMARQVLPIPSWHRAEPVAATAPKVKVHRAWLKSSGVEIGRNDMMVRATTTARYVITVDRVGNLEAREKQKGKVRWLAKAGKHIMTGPAVGSGIAVVVKRKGEVVAVDSHTGKIVWHTPLNEQIFALPAISNGRVFLKTMEDHIIALSAKTGKELWRHSETAPKFMMRASGRPRVFRDRVIVGLANGKVMALKASNGKVLWQKRMAMSSGANSLQRMVDIDVDPVIYNGMVYVAGLHGVLAALDVFSGEVIWQHRMSAYAGLAVSAHAVYVADTKGNVFAFDRESGAVLWKQKQFQGYKLTGPAVQGKYVLLGSLNGQLYWLSQKDGHVSSVVQVMRRGSIIGSPVTSEGHAFVLTSSGMLASYVIVPKG